MKSFTEYRAAMKQPTDIQKALGAIKRNMLHYRREARKSIMLKDKLGALAKEKHYASVLREMRRKVFDIEDELLTNL